MGGRKETDMIVLFFIRGTDRGSIYYLFDGDFKERTKRAGTMRLNWNIHRDWLENLTGKGVKELWVPIC